jgi:LmbE family N-acetylglucosaminyl deacetylase
MATAVFFHAHPDDEAIATGGTMIRAAEAGHRVVLVCATDGSVGEVDDGVLGPGESLAARRTSELRAAAEILGVHRVEELGYRDSGMAGSDHGRHPDAFCQVDVEAAARRLAEVLDGERVDVLTCYDSNGGYGHPDHIQVHRVGHTAARLLGVPNVYESTMNREHVTRLMELWRLHGDPSDMADDFDVVSFGSPEAHITTAVDVTDVLARKRAAMAAHGSQIGDQSFFLTLPEDAFATAFGVEWYIRVGARAAGREAELAGLGS